MLREKRLQLLVPESRLVKKLTLQQVLTVLRIRWCHQWAIDIPSTNNLLLEAALLKFSNWPRMPCLLRLGSIGPNLPKAGGFSASETRHEPQMLPETREKQAVNYAYR